MNKHHKYKAARKMFPMIETNPFFSCAGGVGHNTGPVLVMGCQQCFESFNIDSLQDDGNTCLHLSAELGDLPVTRFLLSQKAKPNIVNNVSIYRFEQGTLIFELCLVYWKKV